MAHDARPERVEITVDALTIEVFRIASSPLWGEAVRLASAWAAAKSTAAQIDALRDMAAFFVAEAQPTWAIVDQRGAVPPTVGGVLRLADTLQLALFSEWTDTIREKETAVDKLVAPSPLRDQLNAKLRAKRKAA
jgi:hypothetical protein